MPMLAEVVTAHLPFLEGLTDVQAPRLPGPGVWSAKRSLGHPIDSGVNTHPRFVCADLHASLEPTLSIGGEPVTLRFVAEDDVRHRLHPLAQIPGRVEL